MLQPFRLFLDQVGLHGKIGSGQIQGLFVIHTASSKSLTPSLIITEGYVKEKADLAPFHIKLIRGELFLKPKANEGPKIPGSDEPNPPDGVPG